MDNPSIYSDGLANSNKDGSLRTQQKMLGALKNMGGDATDPATQSVTTVTAVAAQILAANTSRKFLTLQNTGTNAVFVKFGSSPTLTPSKSFAFVLKPATAVNAGDGGVLSLQTYTGSVHAITAAGNSDVAITEFS